MELGLNKEELKEKFSFGKTPQKAAETLLGPPGTDWRDVVSIFVKAIINKNIEVIIANNQRIAEQIEKAGIKLQD